MKVQRFHVHVEYEQEIGPDGATIADERDFWRSVLRNLDKVLSFRIIKVGKAKEKTK